MSNTCGLVKTTSKQQISLEQIHAHALQFMIPCLRGSVMTYSKIGMSHLSGQTQNSQMGTRLHANGCMTMCQIYAKGIYNRNTWYATKVHKTNLGLIIFI